MELYLLPGEFLFSCLFFSCCKLKPVLLGNMLVVVAFPCMFANYMLSSAAFIVCCKPYLQLCNEFS